MQVQVYVAARLLDQRFDTSLRDYSTNTAGLTPSRDGEPSSSSSWEGLSGLTGLKGLKGLKGLRCLTGLESECERVVEPTDFTDLSDLLPSSCAIFPGYGFDTPP